MISAGGIARVRKHPVPSPRGVTERSGEVYGDQSEEAHCRCMKCTNQPTRRGNDKGHGAKGVKIPPNKWAVSLKADRVSPCIPE